jgi:protoporphyrinogen oxidase
VRTSHRVAVIGGGISGLASALRISRLGHPVTLFEGESFLGGLGTTFPYGDGDLERFYHCILPDDDALIRVIEDVGLGDELLWRGTDMGFMYRGSVHSLNTPLDVLRFSPLSIVDRLRLGMLGITARRSGMNDSLDDVAVDDWLRRHIGNRAFEILWKPLLEAKIGDSYPGIPALWLSSRMSREKSTKRETKGCLRGGYRSLIDATERALLDAGAQIRLGTRIASIDNLDGRMVVRIEGGGAEMYDTVVATSPLIAFQKMIAGLDLGAIQDLTLDYQGVVSGVFLMRKPLSRYYWMPIVDSGATCQGVIEMSNLVPLERSNGLYVTYLVNYTHRSSELFAMSDEELLGRYRQDLATLFPDVGREIVDAFLFRAPFVEPIWPLGYRASRPPTSLLPGRLYLASTAQVYPNVNSWNSCATVVEEMMIGFEAETSGMLRRESVA